MQPNEQILIDNLFQRLIEVEKNSGPRDIEAEKKIREFIQQQPVAPYYMLQSLLIQEAALKHFNKKIQELQSEINELKNNQKSSSNSFLSGFFNKKGSKEKLQTIVQTASPDYNKTPISSSSVNSNYSGFMSGALQTAVGVAGGMVLGDILTNMFHDTKPIEIIDSINDTSEFINNDSLLNQKFDSSDLATFNSLSDQSLNEISSNDEWEMNDFNDDDFI